MNRWEFPGGRLHKDENPYTGLVREIKEELNIDITIKEPLYVTRTYHEQAQSWTVFIGYMCDIVDDTTMKVDTTEIEEMKWITKDELQIIELYPNCREMADVFLKK